ncbi:MAG: hypothetical protein RIG63_27685, partial [Coleofasciculus chthonoplastes F3-SA18-01]|uniref:hypothetical protein n=1 Tax=Coleofasciculus chthonoplastes TaxID=64178 RepID=UPI0032F7A0C5
MSQLNIQSLKAEDLSAEELQLQKAQQVIDKLFMAANSDEKLFEQLEAEDVSSRGTNVCRGGFHDYLFGCTRDVTKPAPTQVSRLAVKSYI